MTSKTLPYCIYVFKNDINNVVFSLFYNDGCYDFI